MRAYCTPGDALHHGDGTHRTSPRSAHGTEVANYERRIGAHLADMPAEQLAIGRVAAVVRELNTADGNPRWSLTFADGRTVATEGGYSIGYEVDYRTPGRQVRLRLNQAGRAYEISAL